MLHQVSLRRVHMYSSSDTVEPKPPILEDELADHPDNSFRRTERACVFSVTQYYHQVGHSLSFVIGLGIYRTPDPAKKGTLALARTAL